MDKWTAFYTPFFESEEAVAQFVEELEALQPSDPKHRAKIMMHQTQRLVSLADDLPQIRPQRAALQLLFLLICAEHICKLYYRFVGEGQSRAYTKRFFEKLVHLEDQSRIQNSFSRVSRPHVRTLGVMDVVNLLYDVRCDVVHEGKYWGLAFSDGCTPMVNVEPRVIVEMTFEELRAIVVRGCISAIRTYPGADN